MKQTFAALIVSSIIWPAHEPCAADGVGAPGTLPPLTPNHAQLAPGARVRVSVAPGQRLVGAVVEARTDTLVLKVGADARQRAVPWATVTRLEVSSGPRTARFLAAVGVGFVLGAVAGSLVDSWACGYVEEDDCEASRGRGLGMGLIGMLPGALVGARLGSEVWTTVPLGRVHLGVSASLPGRLSIRAWIGDPHRPTRGH